MSIKTKMAALTLAALVATGSIAVTATSAEARDFHGEHGFQEDLALQLLFLWASESMGNHDSNVMDAGRVC